jgi:hypothetical protein
MFIVALRKIVAEVRAAALSAGQGGVQDGVRYAAQGLGFRKAAASFALPQQHLQTIGKFLLRGEALQKVEPLAQ